jgi:hypothetical protein
MPSWQSDRMPPLITPSKLPAPKAAALDCGHTFYARCLPSRGDLVWCWSCDDWRLVTSGTRVNDVAEYDAETVTIIRRHSGGKPASIHLAMQHDISQPPRKINGYHGGRWFRRSEGDILCGPWPSWHHGTVAVPTNAAATCPACRATAAARSISYPQPKQRRAASGNHHSGDASTAAA